MSLFGLFWAASLPSHVLFLAEPPLLQSFTTFAFDVNAEELPSGSFGWVSGAEGSLPPDPEPRELQPQLHWPQANPVDWSLWAATAAVTVVSTSQVDPGEGDSAFQNSVCAAHGRDLPGRDQAIAASTSPGSDPTETANSGFVIQVNDVPIGQVATATAADQVAQQIRQALPALETNPTGLTPHISPDMVEGQLDGQTVFTLPAPHGDNPALTTVHWVNNLRYALGAPPLEPSRVHMVAEGLGETSEILEGIASWYGPYFHGRQTATGEIFDQHELTAAHKTLPFGTTLKVRNLLNDKTVIVRINDRGPYIGDRSLDLSYGAAQCLGAEEVGLIPYQATILAEGWPQAWQAEVITASR